MRHGPSARGVGTALAAGLVTRALLAAVPHLPEQARRPWTRRNHAGAEVTLLEGPAVVAGLAAGALGDGRRADALVVLLTGLVGGADDLVGDTGTKGLRGHLGALADGRVTTGAVKIAALAGTAVLVAARQPTPQDLPRPVAVARDAVVVAGTANLVNLLDLRPGRALKAAGAVACALLLARPARAGSRDVLPVLGVVGAALPDDLAGRAMLGDCGSNTVGATLGIGLLRSLGPRGRALTAVGLVGLTLLSERVSFSEVIERTPCLHRVDMWGRPAPVTAAGDPA